MMMPASLTKRIVRNTLFNFTGRFWAMFLGLLLTPFLVAKLGMAGYALWSLVLVITNYLLTWDLGLGTALVRHVAHYYAQQDYDGLNSVMNTALLLYTALATVAITLTAVLHPVVLSAFRVPPEQWEEAGWVLIMAVVAFTLGNVFVVFQDLVTGLQQMHLTNMITVLSATLNTLGAVAFLQLGYGLRGLALNEIITVGLTTSFSAVVAFRVFPMLRLNPLLVRRETLKMLLGFGLKVQITGLGALINLQMNKLLIGYFLGLNLLAAYELGFKLVYSLISLLRLLSSAVMPAAAELHAQYDHGHLQRLYGQGAKYVVLAIAPLGFITIIYARSIAAAWLGTPPPEVARVVQFLMLAYGFNLLTAMGTAMARGVGHPEFETRYAILVVVANLSLGIVLMHLLGLDGLLVATLVAIVLGSSYFLIQWHRFLHQTWRILWHKLYAPPLWACLLASVPSYLAGRGFLAYLPAGRLAHATAGLSGGLVFASLYALFIWRSGYWDAQDRALYRAILRLPSP
jgi:O-antigen/teichoic acid export membrane protein